MNQVQLHQAQLILVAGQVTRIVMMWAGHATYQPIASLESRLDNWQLILALRGATEFK